jgi:FKBP-type peptidyl-prolyl cis-trans isomerase
MRALSLSVGSSQLGSGKVIPALEEMLLGMAEGGVRQIVVPPQIGYPDDDPSHERVGPKPTTFSGQVPP